MDVPGPIRIEFCDGEIVHVPALGGESVLVSAEKAGNILASNCRQGICRTCAARNEKGDDVLLCVEPARPGLAFTLPYRRIDAVPPSLRRAKINAVARRSRSVWEIRYRLQFPLPFLPGQYVEATFPGIDGARRFSMANPPSAKEQVLHVRDLPGGAMASYLGDRAKPEDAFSLRGPFGIFYLRSTPKPKLFVAGGTGLAPILSMVSSIDPASAPRLALVAGFADARDAYALPELRTLAGRLPLELLLTADSADAGWPGAIGNPVGALEQVASLPLSQGTEAYLCGPPAMIDAARAKLLALGLDPADVLSEAFVHAGQAP